MVIKCHRHQRQHQHLSESEIQIPTAASTSSSPPGARLDARCWAGRAIRPSSATCGGMRRRRTGGSLIRVGCACGLMVDGRWIWRAKGGHGRRGKSLLWRRWGLGIDGLRRGVQGDGLGLRLSSLSEIVSVKCTIKLKPQPRYTYYMDSTVVVFL